MRSTYTYAVMDVSPSTYREIKAKLEAAGYGHAIHEGSEGEVLDMHGIALGEAVQAPPEGPRCRRHGVLKLARLHYYCEDCAAEGRPVVVPLAGQAEEACAWCGHPIKAHVVSSGCMECGCRE